MRTSLISAPVLPATLEETDREIVNSSGEKAVPSVLVVDSDSLNGWAMEQTLLDCGSNVIRVCDSASAVGAIARAKRRFDAVVLDLQAPEVSLSLLTLVRIMSPASVVIVTTAFDGPEVAEAVCRGARLVMRKPFEMRDFASGVFDACNGSRGRTSA